MGGIGVLLPYRRTHPIPHLEDGEAGECETGRNGSARIGHRQRGFVAYCLMFFLLGWLTLGIGWLVWYHKLTSRIGTEQAARGLPVTVTAATYWLWNILGSLIIVGPFIYTYKLLHAMNDLCADYNARG